MIAIVLVFLVAAVSVKAVEINCETSRRYQKVESCCFLNGTTEIREENVEFGGLENFSVNVILLDGNQKIEFLPVNIFKKFSNLEIYLARRVSIKKVLALNFVGLVKLRLLDLSYNEIEFVPDECFQDLKSVEVISLSK